MADNVIVFDSRSVSALLYLQNQDLSGKTPEEICDLYDATYDKISRYRNTKSKPNLPTWFGEH